jgi:cysteinyl-tRNA synthetase
VDRFLTSVGVTRHLQHAQPDSRAAAVAQAAVDIRSKVKEFGLGLPNPLRQQCLSLADWARDDALANAGVVLKDGPSKTTWRWKD